LNERNRDKDDRRTHTKCLVLFRVISWIELLEVGLIELNS